MTTKEFMDFIAEKCARCKNFRIHDDDTLICDLEDDICKYEERLYEPLHIKYCKDCIFFTEGNFCVGKDKIRSPFGNRCKEYIYVCKSYSR